MTIPEKLTGELACILEDCGPPDRQSPEALAELIRHYQPTWDRIAAALAATPEPDMNDVTDDVSPDVASAIRHFYNNAYALQKNEATAAPPEQPAAAPVTESETPATLGGQIAAIYGELDAEDCNWIDREWIKWRGAGTIAFALSSTDGTRVQPEALTGCLHPGNEPLSCQYEGQCLSAACDHNGKTWRAPRMTLEAQDPNVLYPNNNEGK